MKRSLREAFPLSNCEDDLMMVAQHLPLLAATVQLHAKLRVLNRRFANHAHAIRVADLVRRTEGPARNAARGWIGAHRWYVLPKFPEFVREGNIGGITACIVGWPNLTTDLLNLAIVHYPKLPVISWALAHGIEPTEEDFWRACRLGQTSIIKMMLDHGFVCSRAVMGRVLVPAPVEDLSMEVLKARLYLRNRMKYRPGPWCAGYEPVYD